LKKGITDSSCEQQDIPTTIMYQNMSKEEQEQLRDDFFDAARNDDLDFMIQCINKGIDAETTIENSILKYEAFFVREKTTTLQIACANGYFDMVQYLTNDCHVNVETSGIDEYTALLYAADYGHLEIARYLTNVHRANVEAVSMQGNTALHIVVKKGDLEMVQFLTKECNANIETKNKYDGWTPLHTAISHGNISIVQYLIDECHADMTAITNEGENVFDIASGTNHPMNVMVDFVVYLLQALKWKGSGKRKRSDE
jgi:ankyrin repeat protein